MKCFRTYAKLISALIVSMVTVISCDDNDSFTTSYSNALTMARDTICLDTVFSKVPSASKKVMIYNNSGDGIRISSIRQEKGAAKSGFRVNVNGMYISPEENNTISTEIEFRAGDSIRVWAELTSTKENGTDKPVRIDDKVLFNLESGRQQYVALKAWTWDADTLCNHFLSQDSVIDNKNGKPLIVYGKLTVNPDVTLTVKAGSKIYFHQDGELDVKGRLLVSGDKDNTVIFRCDRLDSLLQLKYDQIPGKWRGVTFEKSSLGNEISYLDLHGSEYGILCDSSEYTSLDDIPQKLTMHHSSIMNVLGNGLESLASKVTIEDCLIANARGHCLSATGGDVRINSSTLAAFYGYMTTGKYALRMSDYLTEDKQIPLNFNMQNSIVTGYADDQVYWFPLNKDDENSTILLKKCYLRTPEPEDEYSKKMLQDDLYDANSDEEYRGKGLFVAVNETGSDFIYDFTPKAGAPVVKSADAETSCKDDITGKPRKDSPDMGCYETQETTEK